MADKNKIQNKKGMVTDLRKNGKDVTWKPRAGVRLTALLIAALMAAPLLLSSCGPKGGADDTGGANTAGADTADAPVGTDGGQDTAGAPVTGGKNPPTAGGFDGMTLTVSGDGSYDISDNLFGIFLEDINHAVDGGLYAEMVFNRSFEYGDLATLGGKQGWSGQTLVTFDIIDGMSDGSYLNEQNPHYARVTNDSDEIRGIANTGYYNDIYVTEGGEYRISVYARGCDGYSGALYAVVADGSGKEYASAELAESLTGEWHKYEAVVKATGTASSNLRLYVRIGRGTVDVDMVSLFPTDTYKGRENGFRRDIAEMIEDLHPRFLRFPGGCIIEGVDLDSAYDWKDSIGRGLEFEINGEMTVGDVATRPLEANIWADEVNKQADAYYMTYGIGFYEYFLFCEDLGCEPIPILNCGYSCQGQAPAGGPDAPPLDSDEFKSYIQDALDLVEFCMGGVDTKWGGIRAAMGHPEPFHLTYIGIGNEQYGDEYNARYAKFREAFNEAKANNPDMYGGIKLIMANGLTSGSRDGWNAVEKYGNDLADALDEHYYNDPAWFLSSTNRYDEYPREEGRPTVFIGEYASRSNIARSAMAEAAYMTSIERNGDVVELAAYAPLLAYLNHTQWAPNLIWYDNTHVWGSTNYYVQKIYMDNQSKRILRSRTRTAGRRVRR